MTRHLFAGIHCTLLHMCTRYLKIIIVSMVLGSALKFLYLNPSSKEFITSYSDRLRDYVVSSPNHKGYYNEEQCVPHHHVFFLKSHKCGSTTVQNVLVRYGINHNLTFALPGTGHNLGYPAKFRANMIPKSLLPPSGKVDIFTQHSRLNVPEHSKVLYEDTKWIAIVREPVTLFESLFTFYKMEKTYGFNLTQFKDQPLSKIMSVPRLRSSFGKNQMLFEIGYSGDETGNDLQRAIDEMDNLFDLVLVSELMEESLILLRHLLCWSVRDVVVFTLNARREDTKSYLDSDTVAALSEVNSADVVLYDHFLARHQSAVMKFGATRMAKEVSSLLNLRNEYYKNCGVQQFKGKDPSLKAKMFSPLVNALVPTNTSDQNCIMFTMDEMKLTQMLRKHHQ